MMSILDQIWTIVRIAPSPFSAPLLIRNFFKLDPVGCTGKCLGIGIRGHNGSPYDKGMKYCSGCEKFFFSERAQCFCCGRRLRVNLG